MCGRYALAMPVDELQRRFGFAERPNLAPSYNLAPTQAAPVIRRRPDSGGRELALLRWGLVPAWSEGPNNRFSMLNARAETVATKPAYRAAFRQRRCLVPADGFYEWRSERGSKQPYFIRLRSGEPMAFAGLWERWTSPDDRDAIESFTIIATEANALLRPIHDRMPVILAPEDHDRWLDPEAADGRGLLKPCPPGWLEAYPASARLNRPHKRSGCAPSVRPGEPVTRRGLASGGASPLRPPPTGGPRLRLRAEPALALLGRDPGVVVKLLNCSPGMCRSLLRELLPLMTHARGAVRAKAF